MQTEKIKLFLVDDDALFLKSLKIQFHQLGYLNIETYATGVACLKALTKKPDIIILGYRLDGIEKNTMNGLETLDSVKLIKPDIPVIILSAQDKISVAIDCMHHNAYDYVVKSETAFVRLQTIISTVFKYKKMEKELN
ncbi:MAG: two-component system OmpR family response regulator [Cyclobacteriaceae bacterium]|jgi:DNA-binding NtrC family response regulator